ncbi:MAG: rhamnosyltransferase [Saprospiraceae bacterium]|jgi:rhamnosyltransferase
MSYSPKVAILMAVYNGSEYIDEQIASILSQQYVDLTVFISIDRSVDDSYLKCRGWAESDPRIILLKYGERFGSAGRNFFHLINSVSLDDFDYVAFSDQDDIWLPGKLARGISLMKSCSYDAYSSNVIAFWPSNRVKLIDKAQEQTHQDFYYEAAGPGCTYILKKVVLQKIKDDCLCVESSDIKVELHDWLLYACARANNYKWFIDPKPSLLYRQHDANVMGANSGLRVFFKRISMIFDGWYLSQVHELQIILKHQPEKMGFMRLISGGVFTLRRRKMESLILAIILFIHK